jgi:flagellar protein FliO/FliZ
MFELFGAEMPLAVRFFLAFLVVLGLIGATAWAVRRFGSGALRASGMRGRQPRLAVIDHTTVDQRRRLVLVRRDNIEHLLMIGGPTDVVVESNIVRGTPAPREVNLPRPSAAPEALSRAIPLPEAETNGSWPLQPEHSGPPALPRRAPRIEAIPEEPPGFSPAPHSETPPRRQRDVLAALADDLTASPVTPMPPPRARSAGPPRPPPSEPRLEPRTELRTEPRMPAVSSDPDTSAVDQSLAEMAQRLEAALRKPKTNVDARDANVPPPPAPRVAPAPEPAAEPEAAAAPPPPPRPPSPPPLAAQPRAARPVDGKVTRPDGKPKEGKAIYDSLEQEMASLLGRPPGKT